jgi:hypothetical protein
MLNQNPEQIARDHIDAALTKSEWVVQGMKQLNLRAGVGVAVREYSTDVGLADYMLLPAPMLSPWSVCFLCIKCYQAYFLRLLKQMMV